MFERSKGVFLWSISICFLTDFHDSLSGSHHVCVSFRVICRIGVGFSCRCESETVSQVRVSAVSEFSILEASLPCVDTLESVTFWPFSGALEPV